MLDSAQTIVAQYRYSTFGQLEAKTGTVDQPFGFSTKRTDSALGLVYYGYRFYSPDQERWLNRDPLGEEGGINLYAFVGNNPVNWVDPWGLFEFVNPFTYWGDAARGGTIFYENYWNMRNANVIGADKYFHCMANCRSARVGKGGLDISRFISEGREIRDEYIKGDSPADCDLDRAANNQGRHGDRNIPCDKVCGSLRPNGLPLIY